MPGKQQGVLLPVWRQDVIIISKEYAPPGAKTLILLDFGWIGLHDFGQKDMSSLIFLFKITGNVI